VEKTPYLLITAILIPQSLSCYWGKILSLRMISYLRLNDLRLTTAHQRSTGQNLPSLVYTNYESLSSRLYPTAIALQIWTSEYVVKRMRREKWMYCISLVSNLMMSIYCDETLSCMKRNSLKLY
jgi:hypothetical protein